MISKDTILMNIEIISDTITAFQGVDVGMVMDYLGQIVSIQTTATETYAAARYYHLESINNELDRQARLLLGDKIAPSIKKLRADAMCREWEYISKTAERLCSNVSHTIDATRTKISYFKQEMENSKFQNT